MNLIGQGTIVVKSRDVRVNVSADLLAYYRWFVEKHFWMHVSPPLHIGHITVVSEKIHNVDTTSVRHFHNTTVQFEYSPFITIGGRRKNFRNFYLKVWSETLQNIKRSCKIEDGSTLHITVGNTKNTPKTQWFPSLISLNGQTVKDKIKT